MLKHVLSWKFLRICILLFILLLVWQNVKTQKTLSTNWDIPLDVIYYPINADGQVRTEQYIQNLNEKNLQPINTFLSKQAQRYKLDLNTAVNFHIDRSVKEKPPLPPTNGSALSNAWWSLKFRWWTRQYKPKDLKVWQIRLYTLYYTPEDNMRLAHSTGLEKGLVGLIHLFADKSQDKGNNIITAHELLHTLGATDKYDLSTGQAIYPDGYGNPNKQPLYPQNKSEVMAVQKAISETKMEFPSDLTSVVVGDKTAREIGWTNKP